VGTLLELHRNRFCVNHDRPRGVDEIVEQVTRLHRLVAVADALA
jgi:hypothetical protein